DPVRVADRDGIKDSHFSSTLLQADGSIQLAAIEGDAYRQMVQSRKVEILVYSALASHIIASGIVGGQIRSCPECGRLFLLKLNPQANREFHCSTPCTNRATFRRFIEKQRAAAVFEVMHKKIPKPMAEMEKLMDKKIPKPMEKLRAELKRRRNQKPTK